MKPHEYGENNSATLLFFQAAAEPWQVFEDAARLLAQDFHVFLVGADGHDPMGDPGDFISIEKSVDDVIRELQRRGVCALDAVYGLSSVRTICSGGEGQKAPKTRKKPLRK